MIDRDYLKNAILAAEWTKKDIVPAADIMEGLCRKLDDPDSPASSVSDYIGSIQALMRNAIRDIDHATGPDILMLMDTYDHIVNCLKSNQILLDDHTGDGLQYILDMVTLDLSARDY